MQLREYQSQLIADIRSAIVAGHKKICVALATGGGKTVIMSAIVEGILAKCGRFDLYPHSHPGLALTIVHRDVLVNQTHDKMTQWGITAPIGFIKGGRKEDRTAPIQIASVQTLPRRQWWRDLAPRVVIWDEAHITCWAKISRQILDELWPNTIHIGLTATPVRTSKRQGMGDIFTTLVQGPSPADLQAMGSLARMKYYSPKSLNVEGVKIRAGDYDEAELSRRTNTPEITADAIYHWELLSGRQRTLVFCVDCAHAYAVLGAFLEKGISAAVVLGDTPTKDRDRIYQEFEQGIITVIVSVDVLGIGFDSPCAVVGLSLRKSESHSLFLQQIGRLMRPYETKDHGIWIDMVGNCQNPKLILPEDLPAWSLDQGRPPGDCPTKVCPNCNAVIRAFDNPCPECGHEFPVAAKKVIKGVELEEIKPAVNQDVAERREWFREQLRDAYEFRRSPGYATFRYQERYGVWPSQSWKLGAIFGDDPTDSDKLDCWDWLLRVARRSQKDADWIIKNYRAEFGRLATLPEEQNDDDQATVEYYLDYTHW